MAKRVMAEKLKNWKIGCCDYGVADCGCNIYGASSGVAAGVSDVCMGDRDIGDGGDKDEIDRADNGIDGENDAWFFILDVHALNHLSYMIFSSKFSIPKFYEMQMIFVVQRFV